MDLSIIVTIIGVLVAVTNVITQVLKKFTWGRLPTNILVVVTSMVLTVAAFFAYSQIQDIAIMWYTVAAAVVVGFLVAYAAMFGFDKLKETISQFGADAVTDASEITDSAEIETISSLVGMSLAELKEKAEEYGVSTDGLTTKKEIAAAIVAAILN